MKSIDIMWHRYIDRGESKMNKANLLLFAVVPAAIIVPMEVQASEESIEIVNHANELKTVVNSTKKIETYQWYTVVGGIENEISGATSSTYSVPLGSNEKLIVKAILEDGTELVSMPITINTVDILGDFRVNSIISADIASIPTKPTMKGFQWFYYDNGKKTVIDGATDIEFIIPAKAAGKQIFVEAFSEDGEQFVSKEIKIENIKVVAESIKIKGYSANQYIVPGDTVTAFDPKLSIKSIKVDGSEVDLDPATMNRLLDQITYSFQWLYEVEDSYAFIEGANTEAYTIPQDAEERNINKISVRVIATVGETPSTPTYSPILEIVNKKTENSPVKLLVGKINKLLKNTDTDTMVIYDEAEINASNASDLLKDLLKEYNALTSAAKEKVINYDVLKRAIEDFDTMSKFAQKVVNAKTKAEFEALLLEYEQFDLLTRSTGFKIKDDQGTDYGIFEYIQTQLGYVNEVNAVKDINQAILGLLKISDSYELVEYSHDLNSLKETIKSIEDHIVTLPNDYKAIVQNLDILKTAKTDIKKVESFLEKLKKIDLTETPKKQLSAAKSVRSAYNKLTIKQLSIVPESDIKEILIAAENAEGELLEIVQGSINELIHEETKEYLELPDESNWKENMKKVDSTVLQYKDLSKDTAKYVKNYPSLLQLQKDLKTAEKIIIQIDKYKVLLDSEDVSYSKKLSAYNSADKALKKLTTLQQELVYNKGELSTKPDTPTEEDKELSDKEQEYKDQGIAFIDEINLALESYSDDFEAYAKEIDAVVIKYKNSLNSKARKYVTNYGLLKEAEKDVKAVRSFLTKVEAAEVEIDPAKQYTKIVSIQKTYLKLPQKQQTLASTAYQNLIGILDGDAFVDLSSLNDRIREILPTDNNIYNISIDEIKELDKEYKKLSSAEKKQITNYNILKTALSDVKKVESFEKKYYKATEKTFASVIKAFNALSARQAALVSDDIRDKILDLENQKRDDNDLAIEVVDAINKLESNGFYVGDLKSNVETIRMTYDKDLSTAQKSLVKNYSKLTRAENDLVKVNKVKEIFDEKNKIQQEIQELEKDNPEISEAGLVLIAENIAKLEKMKASKEKEWKSAYNRLSNKLEALYNQTYPKKNL